MTSSPFEVVQCEAAALLVELSSSPQVLEVIIDYQYILFFVFQRQFYLLSRSSGYGLSKWPEKVNTAAPLRKLRSVRKSVFFLSRDSRAAIL